MKNLKINTALLVLYLGFISIGLPDQILGVAWVSMRQTFLKPLESAGIIIALVTAFTIFSSFLSPYFIRRFSANTILIFSTFLISGALFGFAYAPNWLVLLFFCIPMGLGAGTVDASLNNYASKNFDTRQINWLHASWGVGATIGPLVITLVLLKTSSWRTGYAFMAFLLFAFFLMFIFTKKIWGEKQKEELPAREIKKLEFKEILKIKPVLSMLFFFLYAALEVGVGLWAASVLVDSRGFGSAQSGALVTFYWASLTIGRFLIGAIAGKIKAEDIIKFGLIFAFLAMILFSFKNYVLNAIALIIYGLSISGLFPCMMSVGSKRFEENVFDSLCGYQIGFASIGTCALPPIIGVLMNRTNLEILPYVIAVIIIILFLIDRRLNRTD